MKSFITISIILVLSHLSLASQQNTLPEEPWSAIVSMEKGNPMPRWEEDINIRLFGNYTPTDSLMIENSIAVLNQLTETIKMSITGNDRGNLEIFFIDSTNEHLYQSIIGNREDQPSSWSYSMYTMFKGKESFTSPMHYNLAIRRSVIWDENYQNFLTNKLAFALYPRYIDSRYFFNNGIQVKNRPSSIFSPLFSPLNTDDIHPDFKELSEFDSQIIKTIYASDFLELLPIAKKQFGKEYPTWLRENAYAMMAFPLVLVLFLFTGLIILFYKKWGVKIQNKFIRFNVISLLGLLSVAISASLYYVAASQLKDPYFNHFDIMQFFTLSDITGAMAAFLIIGLPALNLFYAIEGIINRSTRHRYFRLFLMFLSTSLIPSGALFAIVYFGNDGIINDENIRYLFFIFSGFIIIGVIRTLISFFILNEKKIKMESEVKLAALRELKTKAELNALHSKINPHFLYNSLNSIAGLAKTDADKTEQMALSLSKLFRYSINKDQSDWSTFSQEMEMVRIYLDIEKVRFDDRLEFTIQLPEELKNEKIPGFIIQPLVENSIKHGISKLVTKGEITTSVHRNDQCIEIAVADNGPAFPDELNPGFGIQSIYDKLEIMYPNRFEMHFLNTPHKHILIKLF